MTRTRRITVGRAKRPLSHLSAALLIASAARCAIADQLVYQGPSPGDWNSAGSGNSWVDQTTGNTTVAVPPAGSDAAVAQGYSVGASDGTVDYDYSYAGTTQLNSLVIDSGNTLQQFSASNLLSVNTSFTAGSVSSGVYMESAGTTVCGSLLLGVGTNSSGTVSLSGGSLASTVAYVGVGGGADFYQGGGAFSTGDLYLGGSAAANVGAFGLYSMSNGSSLAVSGNEYLAVGSNSIGFFAQSGGTHSVSGTVYIGYGSGSFGILGETGGTFSAAAVVNNGILDISGGGANLGLLSGTGQAFIGGTSAAMVVATSIATASLTIRSNSILSLSSLLPATNTISQLIVSGSNNAIYLSGPNASMNLGSATLQAGSSLIYGATSGATVPLSVAGSLTVNDGAELAILSNPSGGVTNTVSTLAINGAGQLDLANHSLITNTSPSTVRQYLINGYHAGAWNGTGGISSVSAATNAGQATALGYTSGTSSVGMALGLSSGQTLVKYTIYGDANLDGKVDISDLNIVLSNFASGKPPTWDTGDFTYAGQTDISDLNIVLSHYSQSAPTTIATPSTAHSSVKAAANSVVSSGPQTLTGAASPSVALGSIALDVNSITGDAVMVPTGNPDVVDTQEASSSGNLLPNNWMDLSNFYSVPHWDDVSVQTINLAEYDASYIGRHNFLTMTAPIDYGDIFNTSGPRDLTFEYGIADTDGTDVDTETGLIVYSQVPEPTTLGLMGLAAAGLLGRRRKANRR